MERKVYQKLFIPVYCKNEHEKAQAQKILEELGGIVRLNADDLIKMAPIARQKMPTIMKLWKKISSGDSMIMKMIDKFV